MTGLAIGVDHRTVAAEVLRRITDCPDTHNQRDWATGPYDGHISDDDHIRDPAMRVTDWEDCGATACVAGHACHVVAIAAGERVPTLSVSLVARRALGLDSEAAAWLFHAGRSTRDVMRALEFMAGYDGAIPITGGMLLSAAIGPQTTSARVPA